MKKVLFALGIALLAFACTQPQKQADTGKKAHRTLQDTLPKDGITLNGLSMDSANTVANAFLQNANASSKTISFWLSKEWVDNIYDLLYNKEPEADGFRLYFGYSNGQNTIIITSTKSSGDNEKAQSGGDHADYFIHDDKFLHTKGAAAIAYYDKAPGAKLFDMDADCPKNDCAISTNNHISCETAHQYVHRYMDSTITINTLSEWWPKEVIANLHKELATASQVVAADGIRIYVGKNELQRDVFIFATTKANAADASIHEDYYMCYDKGLKDDFDNGEACPTNCNNVTWPRTTNP